MHRRHKLLGLVLATAFAAALPGTVSAQLPELQIPDVEVPDVQVPDVQLPGTDLPAIEVPDLEAPEVQVPDLPVVDEPEVTLPDVQTPDIGSTGEVAPSGGAGGGSATDDGRTTAGVTGGGGTGSPTESTRGGGGGGVASGSAPTYTAALRDGGAAGGSRERSSRGGPATRERRLRRLVRDRKACLAALPARQRRVLVQRAGLGARDPRSRTATAARLHLTLDLVRRRERAGLRFLRALGAGCGAAGAGSMLTAAQERAATAGGSPPGPSAARPAIGGYEGERGRIAVLSEREALIDDERAPSAPAVLFPGGVVSPGDGELFAYLLAALALALVGLLGNTRSRDWILRPDR